MDFGEKLRTLRRDRNISQTELAKRLQVSRRTINSWEHEGRRPQDRKLYESIADIFECPLEYLLNDKNGLVSDVYEQFGMSRTHISKTILLDIQAYFMSDSISDEEKDTLMFAIHEAYIDARKATSDTWKKRKVKYPDF